MIKINGVAIHGLKNAISQYNYWLETRGTAYIFFDEEDGEVWASKDNWRRFPNWHIVGHSPGYSARDNRMEKKATMRSVKAEIERECLEFLREREAKEKEIERECLEFLREREAKEKEIEETWVW